jgi:hypothetical protein
MAVRLVVHYYRPAPKECVVRLLARTAILIAGIVVAASCGESAEKRVAREAAEEAAKAKAQATAEAKRLASLWTYNDEPSGNGRERHASIFSTISIETDGQMPRRVRLVFRDRYGWPRSSYLVLEGGDFNCYQGCTVAVSVDDGPPTRMKAQRPATDEAIAMFINDWEALWKMIKGAKQLSIEFPVKGRGTRTATFEVGGLNRSRMRGWDTEPKPGDASQPAAKVP